MNFSDKVRDLWRSHRIDVSILLTRITNEDYKNLTTISASKEEWDVMETYGFILQQFDLPVICISGSIFKVKMV